MLPGRETEERDGQSENRYFSIFDREPSSLIFCKLLHDENAWALIFLQIVEY